VEFLFEESVKFGVAVIKNVEVRNSPPELLLLEKKVFEEIRKKWSLQDLANDEVIKSFRRLYWSYGMDPTKHRISSEALIRRVLQGKNLWRVNNVIDAMNLVSALSRLPVGVIDAEKIKGSIHVRKARKSEEFIKIGGEKILCTGNEIVVSDDAKIIDFGFATADSERVKVTASTKNVLVLVYATPAISDEYLMSTLKTIVEYITRFAKGSVEVQCIKQPK